MKEIQYKDFSLQTHKNNWQRNKPNVCQFELTFKCNLHCKHCYSDCYNNAYYIKKELGTKEVKSILDKIYNSGVIWLCFTGGDPLTRVDFLDIYAYAKEKGFIITIFTNGCSLTEKIADYLKENPPFVIEITLNAVKKSTYESISQVKDSFEKAITGIDMIIKRKLPLKIKTQASKQNLEELDQIGEFLNGLGLKLRPSLMLHARLNGDTTPCNLRINPQQVLDINRKFNLIDQQEDCRGFGLISEVNPQSLITSHPTATNDKNNRLFKRAIQTSDGFHIDPYGNMITCTCMRGPMVQSWKNKTAKNSTLSWTGISNSINLLESSISKAHDELSSRIRGLEFKTDSKCRYCNIRNFCKLCPGWALLETGNMESCVEYFCELAKATYDSLFASGVNEPSRD